MIIKVVLVAVLVLFAAFGFDIRRKPGMTPFTSLVRIVAMKVSALIGAAVYTWSIFQIESFGLVELLTLLLTGGGAALVAVAKVQLRESFSWTGHFLKDTSLITDGIYQYIRNPLYTGVFLFEAGGFLNYAVNGVIRTDLNIWLGLIPAVPLAYALYFTMSMAKREAEKLEEQFGEDYRKYTMTTGMFLPKLSKPKEL